MYVNPFQKIQTVYVSKHQNNKWKKKKAKQKKWFQANLWLFEAVSSAVSLAISTKHHHHNYHRHRSMCVTYASAWLKSEIASKLGTTKPSSSWFEMRKKEIEIETEAKCKNEIEIGKYTNKSSMVLYNIRTKNEEKKTTT